LVRLAGSIAAAANALNIANCKDLMAKSMFDIYGHTMNLFQPCNRAVLQSAVLFYGEHTLPDFEGFMEKAEPAKVNGLP